MKTFNADLWLYLKNELEVFNKKVFFGLAPEDTNAPYCVLHVLDSGEDSLSATLCSDNEDYNVVGVSDLQFNIYSINDMQLDELLQEFNNIISRIKNLTEYRVLSSTRTTTRTASSFSNEVGMGITRFSFRYERL